MYNAAVTGGSNSEEYMGKTTVFIDDRLIEEAMKVSGSKTKKEAITIGLEELIRRKNLEALRRELGSFDLALSLDELEKLRNEQ
jgi:Arc/MetJ family transcription regulator